MIRVLSALLVLVLVFGLAIARPNQNSETTGNPGRGNQGCDSLCGEFDFENPGDMHRFTRELTGMNPKEWVEFVNSFPLFDFKNVGDYIKQVCR